MCCSSAGSAMASFRSANRKAGSLDELWLCRCACRTLRYGGAEEAELALELELLEFALLALLLVLLVPVLVVLVPVLVLRPALELALAPALAAAPLPLLPPLAPPLLLPPPPLALATRPAAASGAKLEAMCLPALVCPSFLFRPGNSFLSLPGPSAAAPFCLLPSAVRLLSSTGRLYRRLVGWCF